MPSRTDALIVAIGPLKTLRRIADDYERRAAVIREAIVAINGHATASSSRRATTTIDGALRLDAARRAAKPKPAKKKSKAERRRATVAFLGLFDRDTPRPHPGGGGRGMGPLLLNGYLKRKGDGYVRTAKELPPL